MDGLAQVELLGQRDEVGHSVLDVIAGPDLRGSAMPSPVVSDHPIALVQEEHHLRVPVVGRQRPAMTENDRLARAPVLEEDLDAVGRRSLSSFSRSPVAGALRG